MSGKRRKKARAGEAEAPGNDLAGVLHAYANDPAFAARVLIDTVLAFARVREQALDAGLPDPLYGDLDEIARCAQERARQHTEQIARGEPVPIDDLILDELYRVSADPDGHFFCQYIKGVSEEDLPDAIAEAEVALLRRETPPGPHTRRRLSNQLVASRWPDKKREKRMLRVFNAVLMRMDRDGLLDQMDGKPKAEVQVALRELAKRWGHASDEALCKAIQPRRLLR